MGEILLSICDTILVILLMTFFHRIWAKVMSERGPGAVGKGIGRGGEEKAAQEPVLFSEGICLTFKCMVLDEICNCPHPFNKDGGNYYIIIKHPSA